MSKARFPGKTVTINGNQLVAYTEARIADCGVYYPITPSTEQGEHFEMSVASGTLNVFGDTVKAVEAEGEHAAQGGAIAISVTGKRVANFTSGQGIVYGLEQYYHAPGKLSTMLLNVGARALTKHALNVHCGHDDVYAALDSGWTMVFAKDAQQAVDQSLILRKVNELSLTPGMNIQDGFLTTHLERTFKELESELIREFLGHPSDIIDCPTPGQVELFGKTRQRVPAIYDLKKPALLGSVQNQEHYMTGVVARGTNFNDYILGFLEKAYEDWAKLTGRKYGILSEYNCEKADTVFLVLGSAAENIEAAIDYIKENDQDEIGVIHLNVIRPFPEAHIVNALKGKKNVIILERSDEPMSGSCPIARDVRTALSKALENSITKSHAHLDSISKDQMPRIFEGVYGLGSRDFRPEHILGVYEYVRGKIARQDGKKASDGESFVYLGVNHQYAVCSSRTPSLLPEGAIAVRIHSVGGWGAITTGKNLAGILGELSKESIHKKNDTDEVIQISANPKYGSEKKGAPTNYFLVVARDRVRVNCDLKHVNVVLCCDPKIFTHTNPLEGMAEGGAFIWESDASQEETWKKIPPKFRKQITDNKIQFYTLSGFAIAHENTNVEALQTRMQGNSFLGAFFSVSPFLKDHGITSEHFKKTVLKQYQKKFGRFGEGVVKSNMNVMDGGFNKVTQISYGELDAADLSSLTGEVLLPKTLGCSTCVDTSAASEIKMETAPLFRVDNYKKEFVHGDYNQKASALTSTGIMPASTGATNSKYVSRIYTPVIDPYKCTQCMSCIEVCPDTALPNTAQDIDVIIARVFKEYVTDTNDSEMLLSKVSELTKSIRTLMNESVADKDIKDFNQELLNLVKALKVSDHSIGEVEAILKTLPLGYGKTKATYQMIEKKNPGEGGLFSIFVSDLCKGCGECVVACGSHEALKMVAETPDVRAEHLSAIDFFKGLPQTPRKYLGLFDPENIEDTRAAILHNHLMVQDNYDSFVGGDGSCAGCGEKSVLRGVVTMTEALMRPLWNHKVERLNLLAEKIRSNGAGAFSKLKENSPESYKAMKMTVLHLIMGMGSENLEETEKRIALEFKGNDQNLIDALVMTLETDAFNHRKLQTVEGDYLGMSVMGMTASTGCNTVYGSTHPSNPHPYPWMNSLFQDGATIGWLVAESFILDHSRRSVLPERISNLLLEGAQDYSMADYDDLLHFSDTQMTDLEVLELPKVWAIGGDGALGDIGFQNLSKTVLQNRPNFHVLMLDTQVYSNTGGQNSDSSIMPGGFDMNQYGKYSEGKLTERKELAQIFTSGHGSPFVACVSMANTAKYYKAVLDGLTYRGMTFIQSFTTCQPEHGVGDDTSQVQAIMVRDCRGVPEFSFNPEKGELYSDNFDLKGNPRTARDWHVKKDAEKKEFVYDVAQWAFYEGRFRKHFYKITPEQEIMSLEDICLRLTQNDVTYRRFLMKDHRAFIPVKGIYTDIVDSNGKRKRMGISRQLVLFNIERRKNWRLLQGRAGIINTDYQAQKEMLKRFDSGEISKDDFFKDTKNIFETIYSELKK